MKRHHALSGRSGAETTSSYRPAGAEKEDVAGFDLDPGGGLSSIEVLGEDRSVRFQPVDAAQAGNIEQDAAADDAATGQIDGAGGGAQGRGYALARHTVVHGPGFSGVGAKEGVGRRWVIV